MPCVCRCESIESTAFGLTMQCSLLERRCARKKVVVTQCRSASEAPNSIALVRLACLAAEGRKKARRVRRFSSVIDGKANPVVA